jgi:hypothetical protein
MTPPRLNLSSLFHFSPEFHFKTLRDVLACAASAGRIQIIQFGTRIALSTPEEVEIVIP